jgi:hypothetical protein
MLDLAYFSDEAWLHLSDYVNSQNIDTWSKKNHHTTRETTLYPVKVGVWCSMAQHKIVGSILSQTL